MSPDLGTPPPAAPATRRPLTARSAIASTLLGVDPPRLPALALVRSGELFGLSEGATRTALSRMAAAGEVVADDGSYGLAGRLLERHARQQEALAPTSRARWDGTWEVAVVTAERRTPAERAALRDAARRLHLAEVREGCWARPANLAPDRSPAERAVVTDQCTTFVGARPDTTTELVDAFDVDAWALGARALLAEIAAAQPSLDRRDVSALGPTFVLDAAALRHLLADPALPPPLVPVDWPSSDLRQAFARFDDGFKATWRSWYRAFRTS